MRNTRSEHVLYRYSPRSGGRWFVLCLLAATAFLGAFPESAYAYLDPGTGSYFFQMMIAVVVGGLFALKMFWRRLREYLKGRRRQRDDQPEKTDDSGIESSSH